MVVEYKNKAKRDGLFQIFFFRQNGKFLKKIAILLNNMLLMQKKKMSAINLDHNPVNMDSIFYQNRSINLRVNRF